MSKVMYHRDHDQRCIVAIVILPAPRNEWDVYVGWEWKRAVDEGYVKFYRSRCSTSTLSYIDIEIVCDFGIKMTHAEILAIFPQYLINKIQETEQENEKN